MGSIWRTSDCIETGRLRKRDDERKGEAKKQKENGGGEMPSSRSRGCGAARRRAKSAAEGEEGESRAKDWGREWRGTS